MQNTNKQRDTLFEGLRVKPPTAAPQQQICVMLGQYTHARPVLLWGLKRLPPGVATACCYSTVLFSMSIQCEHQLSGNSKISGGCVSLAVVMAAHVLYSCHLTAYTADASFS